MSWVSAEGGRQVPVHEVHALANGFGVFHTRQASPKSAQVDFQDVLLAILQCCTAQQGLKKDPQGKRTEDMGKKTMLAALIKGSCMTYLGKT